MADKYFSAREYTDMIVLYGEVGEDAVEAANLYAERFPGRKIFPDANVILSCIRRARKTGCVLQIETETKK